MGADDTVDVKITLTVLPFHLIRTGKWQNENGQTLFDNLFVHRAIAIQAAAESSSACRQATQDGRVGMRSLWL